MRKRKRKQIKLSSIITIFALTLLFISTGYSLLSQELTVAGKGNLVYNPPTTDSGLVFTYKIGKWYNNGTFGYIVIGKLTNNSDALVDGWSIVMDVPSDATEIQCYTSECKIENNKLELTNLSYNGIINQGESTAVSFILYTSDGEFEPGTNIVIKNLADESNPPAPTPTPTDTPSEDNQLKVDIEYNNGWTSGKKYIKQYTFTLQNTLDTTINSWQIKISAPSSSNIVNIYNANYVKKAAEIIFSNVEYNGTIQPGQSISFGFQIEVKTSSYEPVVTEIITN